MGEAEHTGMTIILCVWDIWALITALKPVSSRQRQKKAHVAKAKY